jgi:Trypsin
VEVRYQVYGGEEFCTGTFVGRHQVLTAGHCACGFPGTYEIHVGQAGAEAVFPVTAVVLYDPRVCAGYDLHSRDLALLITGTDLDCKGGARMSRADRADYKKDCQASGPALTIRQQFGAQMRSVWDLGRQLTRGQAVAAVGYGKNNAGTHSRRLMAPIPIMSPSCSDGRFPAICASFAEMLLVDTRGQADDTCEGDSGGPVYFMNGATKAPELIATVSQAAPFTQGANGCGGGGVYELLGRVSVQAWLGANGVPDNTIVPVGQSQR